MKYFAAPVERLIEQFERLPGIGHKTAERLTFFVLGMPDDYAQNLSNAILNAKKSICMCSVCQNLTDAHICPVCSSPSRDHSVICVVTDPKDVIAFEKTREFHGVYHVLHGSISPLNGISPDDLKIRELLKRLTDEQVQEVIMATSPDTEGETTAMYISRLIKPFGIKVSRLAYGLPVGGHLEYADEVTLVRALEGRREIL